VEIVNARRGQNPFAGYAGQWILLYQDPGFRLPFCFWDETRQRIPTFKSKDDGIRAMQYHAVSRGFWAIYGRYEPKLVQYESMKEFADYYHQMHYTLEIPVVWFGSVAEMDEVAECRRLITPGVVPTMTGLMAVGE